MRKKAVKEQVAMRKLTERVVLAGSHLLEAYVKTDPEPWHGSL